VLLPKIYKIIFIKTLFIFYAIRCLKQILTSAWLKKPTSIYICKRIKCILNFMRFKA